MHFKSNDAKGIACILLAAFGFALMTFFVRLSGGVPTMEKAFFRNAFAAVIAMVTLIRSEDKFKIKKGNGKYIFLRCLFGTTGLLCNFYAIDHLPLADANMLNKLSPFFAIIASIPILKEKPTKIDILTTIGAFCGVILIARPSPDVSIVPALAGLWGGAGAGIAYTFVRLLGKPAYKFAPARKIGVFDNTQVVFSAFLAIAFFGEIPEVFSIIGYVIIIGMAVFRWYWNLKHENEEVSAAS